MALQGRDLSRFYGGRPATCATCRRSSGGTRQLPLGRRGSEGERLRVRIDGPPGLWSIGRAVVASEGAGRFEQERLAPVRATREDETDVTELLSRADGRRHSLRPLMDAVTLRFLAPPRRPGRLRSVLVEATGCYDVVVPAEGEPQRLAFRRLVEEPGGEVHPRAEAPRTGGGNTPMSPRFGA